jgi:hypothetical protein
MAEKLDIEASLSKLSPEARARVEKILQESLAKETAAAAAASAHDKSYDRDRPTLE